MAKMVIKTECPSCGKEVIADYDLNINQLFAPNLRCKAVPTSLIGEYRIPFELIRQFITHKARKYVPNIKVEVAARYCEKKQKKQNELLHSYASFRIALFDDSADKKDNDNGWYEKIGESDSNLKIHKSLMEGIVNKYIYDKSKVDSWLKDYKTLEDLENGLGITENFIKDIREYTIPQRIKGWVIFSAAPEKILEDMFTDYRTNKPAGRIKIVNVSSISKDTVEYLIHLYMQDPTVKVDPFVRQLLLGEEKNK